MSSHVQKSSPTNRHAWRASGLGILVVATVACTPTSSEKIFQPDAAVDTAPKPRAFVTSTSYSGDLKTAGAGSSGLDGADKLCQAASTAAGLAGTFKAWLSDSTTNAIDRLTDVGGWYMVGGQAFELFDSKAALVSPPANPFADETGAVVDSEPWTGTLANGTENSNDGFVGTTGNCLSWTASLMDSGATGSSGEPGSWTQSAAYQCQNLRPIYCFQQ
jgi:hypothetical protein